MSRFDYITPCPTCSTLGLKATLGFQTDTGKITCNGETVHSFDEMPAEAPLGGELVKPEETPHLEKTDGVQEREWTPEEEAALDAQMAQKPKRDFGHMLGDEPVASELAPIAPEIEVMAPAEGFGLPQQVELRESETGHSQVLVVEGGFVPLPNGDVLVGVRISETWVSCLQAEAESQSPAKTLPQYVQELIDMGMIDWHMAAPSPR